MHMLLLNGSVAMCKSSSLAFVLLFAFAFKLERPTWTLAGVIGVICVGLFMMVMSEVDFVLIGYDTLFQNGIFKIHSH